MTAIAPIHNTASDATKPFDWQAIANDFIAIVGDRFVVRTREELIAYECDGLTSYKQQPAIVVLPLTTEEVSQVVKVCDRYKVAFVARGSGDRFIGRRFAVAWLSADRHIAHEKDFGSWFW